jgi:Cysteine-rich secretory protein family
MPRTLPLALLFALLLTAPAHAQTPNEQLLLVLANQSRAEHNLPPLTWDPALARAAHAHLLVMARQGGPAEHQYPGEPDLLTRSSQAGAHFSSIAENVAGSGQSAAAIHQAWMNSPPHRANLLAPQLTAVGIAVAATPTGLYAVEDFGRTANSTASSAEKQVQQLLLARGIQPDSTPQSKQDAHANCESGTQPESYPTLIMQWESGDFTQLPPQLLQRLPPPNSQKPQTAAVASCPPQKPTPGFTTYRIAVLIY